MFSSSVASTIALPAADDVDGILLGVPQQGGELAVAVAGAEISLHLLTELGSPGLLPLGNQDRVQLVDRCGGGLGVGLHSQDTLLQHYFLGGRFRRFVDFDFITFSLSYQL